MIDIRSDTVTRPSDAMRAALAAAPVGDDVYSDDPTVNALEERVPALFGKEAGVFTPTGSLSNQLGIRTLVRPGEELITETFSHIVRAELGAGAVFSGITTRTWEGDHGLLKADAAMAIARPDSGPYLVSTTAIAVENTHNFGGGTVQPIEEIRKLRAESKKVGIAMHLDGARIWNAHVASGVPLHEYAKYFDTMSVCFSKGLGAPVGSMILSTKERITEARIWRKRYGAGMRQIGILAGAINYALDHNIERLKIDHEQAAKIAAACGLPKPDTNIVALDVSKFPFDAAQYANTLRENGVLAGALGKNFVRLVTHMDLTNEDIDQVCEILKRTLVA